MPIYEYRCHDCRRRVNILWRSIAEAEAATPRCPRCGGENLSRLVSRVAILKSEESRLEALSDPGAFGDLDENDPRSIGRWMRRMSQEVGEDMGSEFDEVIDRLEAGQSPEDIESAMPDLAGEGEGPSGLED
jgi:putative FmdB family regulatory protein